MRAPRSLRLRLVLISSASIAVALLLVGFLLVELFERHVERRVDAELVAHIEQLAAHVVFDTSGHFALKENPADPRFDRPFGGLYWQIESDRTGQQLRSRSLWDTVLPLPADSLADRRLHLHEVSGLHGEEMRVMERTLSFGDTAGLLRIAVAIDNSSVENAAVGFAADVTLALVLLALVLSSAAAAQVWFGLRPLAAIQGAIAAIRARRARRLEGYFPPEIAPLVMEVNELLATQEKTIEQARNRAGDLAHGLKTPLTVILTTASELRAKGDLALANELEALVRSMQGQIDHALARARLAAAVQGATGVDLGAVAKSVMQTLRRTPKGAVLSWQVEALDDCRVRVDSHDLMEVLGNLLDNAVKWARQAVSLQIWRKSDQVFFCLRDDGPGVPQAALSQLGQRGQRLDERMPGSGMGLAIVQEILTAYGGKVTFAAAPGGGFEVLLSLPAAA